MQSSVKKEVWTGDAALAVGVLCIAWSGLLVRWAGVSGVTAGFYRMAVAAAVLGPWCLLRRRSYGPIPRRVMVLSALSGALFACDNALFNVAVQRTAVGAATLLANVSPLFVGFGTWMLLGRRPGRDFWLGLVLTTGGSALMMGFGGAGGGPSSRDVSGAGLAILASVFFAAYLMVTERARASAVDTLLFTTLAVWWSAAVLGVACVVLGEPFRGFSPRAWGALVALGLVSQVGGYLAVTFALGRLPATVTAVGLLAQAPVTALIAALVLGERPSMAQMAGGVLVLAGVYLVIQRPRTMSRLPAPAD